MTIELREEVMGHSGVIFFIQLFAGCQEDVFYHPGPSTEVNGRIDNNTVVLGGLFPVHIIKDSDCGGIFDLEIPLLEAMVLAIYSKYKQQFIPTSWSDFEV